VELAQADIEGGGAQAERGRLRREQGIEKTQLETGLAQQRAERGERALFKLGDVGAQQQQIGLEGERVDIDAGSLTEIVRKNLAGEALTGDELRIQEKSVDEIIRKNLAGGGAVIEGATNTVAPRFNPAMEGACFLSLLTISHRVSIFSLTRWRKVASGALMSIVWGWSEDVISEGFMAISFLHAEELCHRQLISQI